MDNLNRSTLLKELAYYTDLLKKHEASKKEEKLSAVKQKCEKSLPQKCIIQPTHLPHKFVKNPTQPSKSYDKKYSFKKSNNLGITNQRILLNKNFNSRYELTKNITSRSSVVEHKRIISNVNKVSVPKRTIICSENKFGRTSTTLSDKSDKINSHTQLMEELKSLTELLKKKNSENKLLSSPVKESSVQNKLLISTNTKDNFNGCKYKSLKSESIFPKTKCQTALPQKVINGNNCSLSNSRTLNKNCYTKLNSKNKIKQSANFSSVKCFDHNKYSYKKVNSNPLSSKSSTTSLKLAESKQVKTQVKKHILGSHIRKVTYSKNFQGNLCSPNHTSILSSKPLLSNKQNLSKKLNVTNSVSSSNETLRKESPPIVKLSTCIKVITPSISKSCKMSKLKPASYVKVNKPLITPNRNVRKNSFSTKKTRKKVNTKYKVINKTITPSLKDKILNSFNSSVSKKNSPIAIDESESFFQKLNDSTIDKLEQDLLTISTVFTSTPMSSKANYKVPQHPQIKDNLTLHSKKMYLKKSKSRISKYKIVNSNVPHNYSMKKHNFVNIKNSFKNVNYSKLSLINKHSYLMHNPTPIKQGKSVFVKRLFKSKNTIINKNTSPINYSAKMIKSKYLTLNKRKLSHWQNPATQVPLFHKKFKGYYSYAKFSSLPNKYKKATAMQYPPKMLRRYPNCSYLTLNKQFSKNLCENKYKRKLKTGLAYSPVVFIHGMRYSLNSSGKTLKKLPAIGQTSKTLGKNSRKIFVRSPEIFMKTSPTSSNIASRVLHRSINRIISASNKKSLTKVNTYCMFYNRFGRCNKGVKCTYIHDPSKIAVCTRFLRGTCKIDGCPFSHEIAPGKMAICSFYLVGACEKENCPYRHEKLFPDAELCKAFVQGYCPDGKECKKAHILICPKYIQGDCDKGNSCAYPHPPRKVKKSVQKEEESEEKKPDDVLLEKVSRYFLQTEDCLLHKNKSNDAARQFVPKHRRRLEEQPSFIPLFESSVSSSN